MKLIKARISIAPIIDLSRHDPRNQNPRLYFHIRRHVYDTNNNENFYREGREKRKDFL